MTKKDLEALRSKYRPPPPPGIVSTQPRVFDARPVSVDVLHLCDEVERLQIEQDNLRETIADTIVKPMEDELSRVVAEAQRLRDSEETAWGIIANAYGGDWDQASESSGWKKAAERWRDEYHKHLPSASDDPEAPAKPQEEE